MDVMAAKPPSDAASSRKSVMSKDEPRKRRQVYSSSVADENDPFIQRGKTFMLRLHRAMLTKGYSQADLTRAANQFMPDGKVINRQAISAYCTKGHMPNRLFLSAIAKALNVKPEELVPANEATFVGSPFSMQSDGNKAHVKLDLTMSLEDAMTVAMLVKKYEH